MTSTINTDTELKARHRALWGRTGDYPFIAIDMIAELGPRLVDAVGVRRGERVLDVAAGTGNASVPAALAGAEVVASDLAPELFEAGRTFAARHGVTLAWEEADAENLPYADASFDVVLSCIGAMFAPRHQRTADELVRVCRPGGTIGLLSWTPEGFIGQMFKIVGRYAPPPAGIRSPLEWGKEARLAELFGADARVEVQRRQFVFRYRSAEHWLAAFRDYYGPTFKAFGALDEDGQAAFAADLLAHANSHNTSITGTLRVPSEYLEVVAVKAR